MKTYRDPVTGRVETWDESNKDVIAALTELGFEEVKAGPEGTPASAEVKPLNPNAQVHTKEDVAAARASKQASAATPAAPPAPAVPKKPS